MSQRLRGTIIVVMSSFFFAAMAVVSRSLAGEVSAGQQVFLRFVIGLLGVSPVFIMRRQLPRVGLPMLWVMRGVFGGVAVYWYFVAIERLGAGPATLLNYTSPIYTAIFSAIFLREPPHRHLLGGLLTALVGAMMVAWSTSDTGRLAELDVGVWAGMGSAIAGGAALTTIRGMRSASADKSVDAYSIFVSFTFFGALMATPFAVSTWRPLTGRLWLLAIAIGILSLIAQLMFTHAFAYVTAIAGSATLQLTPALAWAMAIVFLHEPITPLALAGALITLSGVVWGSGVGEWFFAGNLLAIARRKR